VCRYKVEVCDVACAHVAISPPPAGIIGPWIKAVVTTSCSARIDRLWNGVKRRSASPAYELAIKVITSVKFRRCQQFNSQGLISFLPLQVYRDETANSSKINIKTIFMHV
jgi:hypothetical protein